MTLGLRSTKLIAGAAILVVALAAPIHAAAPAAPAADSPRVDPIDAAGIERALQEARGKVVVLNFWATWCDPCREEFPDLVRFAAENPGQVALITVSLDDPDDVAGKIRPFLREMKVPGRAFVKAAGDPDAFISKVDPKWSGALPATFVHAPDGRRVSAVFGQTSYAGLKAVAGPLLPQAR
ncbi:MAG: TlpA family protein disulfide reductase [Acidobacteria bacterium]|nr:TlpA family protein disulfide reductase [Acidobacteriota bacterium]